MSTALNNNSIRSTVPRTVAISDDDELRLFAPSVFTSKPIEGVSERYSFLPTSSILNGMRENGWVPVRAQEQSIRTEARRGFQEHVVRFARVEHLQTWEKNQVRPEVVLVNSHDKAALTSFIAVCFGWCAPTAWSFPMAPSSASQSNIPGSIRTPLSRLLSKSSLLSLTS